ncbi:MAG: alternative ribosome rescue aminoacyl-tRNA hydrolase ArfB [Allosphingosinicella sp.]|uniref:alternative ribosome rescue aminoacyl-tRNA hydrolase ArfB n=1 Tax=Allosphingosinicella sp. TaxID=2823234 RepID=UPI0039277FF3
MPYELPEEALSETFLAASGPGGQNVNKVATACQLRCDVFALGLPVDVYQRLKTLAGSKLTNEGEIVITARSHRTQEANRIEARQRLTELIERAFVRQPKRKPTKPSRAAKARRVDAKKSRSAVKQGRGKVRLD